MKQPLRSCQAGRVVKTFSLLGSACILVSCGARDSLWTGDSLDGGSAASTGDSPIDCTPAEIRLCGAATPCPPMDSEACPGVGCTPVSNATTGELLEIGICWPDLDDWVSSRCFVCRPGEVCVHYTEGESYCAPLEVCETLLALGAGDACRYTDKTTFTGAPLAIGSACPEHMCGTGCLSCGASGDCVGLSPTHPYGLCAPETLNDGCSLTVPDCPAQRRCGIFNVPAEDQAYAEANGICISAYDCELGEAAELLRCY